MSVCVPSVGVMLDGLRVNLTAAHVFDSQRQPLAVLDLSITHGFKVSLLYFTVFSPDDFSVGVHRHSRLLPTHLYNRGRQITNILGLDTTIIYLIWMSFTDKLS